MKIKTLPKERGRLVLKMKNPFDFCLLIIFTLL